MLIEDDLNARTKKSDRNYSRKIKRNAMADEEELFALCE